MEIPVPRYEWYVPEYGGNRAVYAALETREQAVQVQIKTPTAGSTRRMLAARQSRATASLVQEVQKLMLTVRELQSEAVLSEVRRLFREVVLRTGISPIDDEVDCPWMVEHLGEVCNLTFGGRVIDSGKAFVAAREAMPHELWDELLSAVNRKAVLEEGLAARLPLPSGSSASPSPNGGTVESAA